MCLDVWARTTNTKKNHIHSEINNGIKFTYISHIISTTKKKKVSQWMGYTYKHIDFCFTPNWKMPICLGNVLDDFSFTWICWWCTWAFLNINQIAVFVRLDSNPFFHLFDSFFSWKFGWAGKNACMIHSFFFCSVFFVCFISIHCSSIQNQQFFAHNCRSNKICPSSFGVAFVYKNKIFHSTTMGWLTSRAKKKLYCFYWHARTVIGVFDIDNFFFQIIFFYHINWNRFGSRKQKFRFWYIHILWLSLVWAKFVFFSFDVSLSLTW